MRVAIFNNYKIHLDNRDDCIKNIISYPDNIGNIVFLEAISRQTGAEPISLYDFSENTKYYEDRYDMVILSLANMLSPYFNMPSNILKSLEKTNLKICIFSIGIQVDNTSELFNMPLSETANRILKLSEKSETIIGLRGETTKIYLDSIGVKNTQVIGCPSIFYKKVIPVKSNNIQKILVSGSFYGNWKEKIELLLKFGLNYNADYIIQSESRILVDKYFSENQIDFWNLEKERLEYLKSEDYDYKFYCHKDLTPNEIKKWLVNNSIFFNKFDEWMSSMNYDLSFGVRFHGSIMSILNGVPTLILSGDARVDEFVKYHELPNMKLKLLEDNLKPEDIYDLIDYSEYSYKYEYLKNRYINFLKCNNLEFKDGTSR